MAITAIQFVCLCTFAESAPWNCYLAEKSPVAASQASPASSFHRVQKHAFMDRH